MRETSDLSDLEQRLSAALERIGTALDGLVRPATAGAATVEPVSELALPDSAGPDAAPVAADAAANLPPAPDAPDGHAEPDVAAAADLQELARLRSALEDERIVTAQLEERIRRLKARDGDSALRGELDDARGALARMDADLQALRQANAALRAAAAALRTAAETGVADAALINRTLEAELAALSATRAADAAEAEAILTAMAPLLVVPAQSAETEEL